jgi:hypothetical protein
VQASPSQLVFGAQRALGRVHGFHLEGIEEDLHGRATSIVADFRLPGRLEMSFVRGGERIEFRLVAGYGYLKAPRSFWATANRHLPAQALGLVADHWVKVPAATSGFAVFAAWANPSTIGECMIGSNLGTVSVAGRATVAGRPAIALIDHGDLPGSARGKLYVTATGALLPLRVTQTGPQRRGGVSDPARNEPSGSNSSDTKAGDLRFSRYNESVSIIALASTVNPAQLRSAILASVPAPAAGGKTAQEAQMVGTWSATGRVVEARNWADEQAGQTIVRAWRIQRRCSSDGCRLYLTRQTAQTPLTTELVWAGGHWTANFRQIVPCTGPVGVTSVQYSRWRIALSSSGIDAVEQGHASAPGAACLPASNLIAWGARRIGVGPTA